VFYQGSQGRPELGHKKECAMLPSDAKGTMVQNAMWLKLIGQDIDCNSELQRSTVGEETSHQKRLKGYRQRFKFKNNEALSFLENFSKKIF
jgi:hypothetical protein